MGRTGRMADTGGRGGRERTDIGIYDMGDTARRMVRTPDWLNVQAACVVAGAAGKFPCNVMVTNGSRHADAKVVVELLALGAEPGETLEVLAEGDGSAEAVRDLASLISGGFGGGGAGAPARP